MGYYENPLIGWFMKKRIKKIIAFFVITLFLYLLLYKFHTHEESFGCSRPDCESTKCTGSNCIASGCNGDNCKAGDCIGEECEAGSCKGVGCRAGDCYGKDCIPGMCIDPECSSKDAKKNLCIPFCRNGTANNIPRGKLYNYTKKFPKNTLINPEYCKNSKLAYILKDNKYLWNYGVDTIYFDYSGAKTPEELANPSDLQAGKTFVLSDDSKFVSTQPNIEKLYNCNWCTKLKDNEICSTYKPYVNPIKKEYTWHPDDWKCETLKSDGKPDTCKKDNSSMKLVNVSSVEHQIKLIDNMNIPNSQKSFKIDEIKGEMLTYQCKENRCSQHINLKNILTNLDGSIVPCQRRSYMIKGVKLNNMTQYAVTGFNKFERGSPEEIAYMKNYETIKKTYRDHHVWVYSKTIDSTQYYKCHWCDKTVEAKNQAIPRKTNGSLEPCFYSNDYNHYMYQMSDSNKDVYLKCFKCEKEVYIK